MRKFITTIGTLSLLLASTPAFAADIQRLDKLTNTTDRYISGELDKRILDLAFDKSRGEQISVWLQTWIGSTKLHCSRTLHSRGRFNAKCGAATARKTVSE